MMLCKIYTVFPRESHKKANVSTKRLSLQNKNILHFLMLLISYFRASIRYFSIYESVSFLYKEF